MESSRGAPARRLATALVRLAVVGFAAAVAAAFVPLHPFALIEHFRVQLAAGGAVVTAAAGVLALRAGWLDARWLDAALIALLVDALVLVPDLASARRDEPPGGGAPVRVLFVNVLTASDRYEDVRRLIAEERPDIVGLVETSEAWLRELAPVLAAYPGRIEAPRGDNFGIALYTRGPLAGGVEHLGARVPAILAAAEIDGVRLGLAVLHPVPPLTGALLDDQLRHFDAVAARVRGGAAPFVVMGDLNTTPWSRAFARLRGGLGACDTRAGFGLQTSFPAGDWLLRIPIDHVLVDCAIGVRERRIGPRVGSDHLPVVVDLVVPR